MWRWILLATPLACSPDDPKEADPDPDTDPVHTALSCPDDNDPRFAELAATIEAERVALGSPGVSVALMLDGELAWCQGFGSKNPAGTEPMGPRTLLRIGSVTKALTALALLQEVEAGGLDLDATLTETMGSDWDFLYAPGVTSQMRVEHLLTHESGIVDYLGLDDPEPLADWTDGTMLNSLWMLAPPGSFFNYTNPGYSIAGRLVEHSAGQLYADRMDEVFTSLGMNRTFFDAEDVEADGDWAIGASVGPTGAPIEILADSYDSPSGRPAGYAWSSVEDLANFADFLMRGEEEILGDELRLGMMDPHVDMLGVPGLSFYGHGLMVQEGIFIGSNFHDMRWITHGGAIPGHSAEMHFIPDQGFALITLANGEGMYFTDALVEALSHFAELPSPSTPPDLSAPDPENYVGLYNDPINVGMMEFSMNEDTFVVTMPRLDELEIPYVPELIPLYGDSFLLGVQGFTLELTFVQDEEGPRWARTRSFVGDRDLVLQPGSLLPRFDKATLRSHAAQPLDPSTRLWLHAQGRLPR